MRVMVVGSGGREHALAKVLKDSPKVSFLVVAPGNPGIGTLAALAPIASDDVASLVNYAVAEHIDLVVVGPEVALAAGLADNLQQAGIACFGPTQGAAQLESSKAFTKALCQANDIPSAAYTIFEDKDKAVAYLRTRSGPFVIKADGLAAGKGVVITTDLQEAEQTIADLFGGRFGGAGSQVVIEEHMVGEEVSFFALCDGKTSRYFGSAQDHKRAYDGEKGPNTGGMGAYSPTSLVTPVFVDDIMERFIDPTLRAMNTLGMPFCGVLYAGLMLTPQGPKLVEYNARFGDPECQALLARFEGDLASVLMACARGELDQAPTFHLNDQSAAVVVLAAQGYPDHPQTGSSIGEEAANQWGEQGYVLHAGTTRDGDGTLRAAGGRVLNAVGTGATLQKALETAYEIVDAIDWPIGFYRRDIGWRELNRKSDNPALLTS
ncbi:phosphoribosylamine--glycine ligase [Candidatus Phycosocius spiralis]|uniref:Phosphoribosylamine--glycine ligase n=1 Tax=Candidatus Phycosocius spiralis TaxID=2815099 RepID=A0ABQ4PWN5_9PROT|nr:phosphoribosylamine--glycine ligase [Candidatus Phycosocius spiralis]GIU67401.1 phosphoribosylamine--glycine ligase [Candidatus Phycosocius spiralis]